MFLFLLLLFCFSKRLLGQSLFKMVNYHPIVINFVKIWEFYVCTVSFLQTNTFFIYNYIFLCLIEAGEKNDSSCYELCCGGIGEAHSKSLLIS